MSAMTPAATEDGAGWRVWGWVRWGQWLAVAVVIGFGLGAWWWGVPSSGEFGFAETLVQFGVLALYVVGVLLSLRWLATGATIMAVTAVGVGALSAVQLHPLRGFMIALALFVPAAMLWWAWRREHGLVAVSTLAAGLVLLLAAGGVASDQIFEYFYGPKAPVSETVALALDDVEWIWTGGVTDESAVVVARLADDEGEVGLQVTESDSAFPPTVQVAVQTPTDDPHVRRFDVSGLSPGRAYDYVVLVDGREDSTRGRGQFTTPRRGPMTFTFTFGSCTRLDSNAATYDAIREADPLFHLIGGDFFYGDIVDDSVSTFGVAYTRQMTPGAPAKLLRDVPVAYMWDDHDYGPNDGDRTSPSREAAWSAYRTYVPHHSLGSREEAGPIYQAFSIGRTRFVLSDLRSERDPDTAPDGPDKTMLGDEQRDWLQRELLRSSRSHQVVFWASSVPWIIDPSNAGDSWGAYAWEREEISRFLDAHGIDNVVMLAGDAHMVAADDGTHSNYADPDRRGFPVLHAAPIDQHTSIKGGPYSEGVVADPGQFGVVTVVDDGGRVTVQFQGRDAYGHVVLSYRWRAPRQ
jgi:hypothetical protein